MSTDTYLPPLPTEVVEWADLDKTEWPNVPLTFLDDGLYLFGAPAPAGRMAIGPMDYMDMDLYLSEVEGPVPGEALGIMSGGECVEFVLVNIATDGTVTWPSIPN